MLDFEVAVDVIPIYQRVEGEVYFKLTWIDVIANDLSLMDLLVDVFTGSIGTI